MRSQPAGRIPRSVWKEKIEPSSSPISKRKGSLQGLIVNIEKLVSKPGLNENKKYLNFTNLTKDKFLKNSKPKFTLMSILEG